ncbi:MAG TPA: nuclear transport factor 2 family protein [Pyrinomonadaceae bacterium]|nr:nuclear transport factor 2 family protein [Pyrinomonadaceae bacterium]
MQKKLWILVAALVAAACAAPSTTNRADTNTNGSAATTAAAAPLTEADAVAKEKGVWAAFEKQDYKGFGDMLDEQALLVQGDGVYDKAGILKGIEGFIPKDVVFSDWKFISLDKDAAVISYKQSFSGTANGQAIPPSTIYATSAWINRNGKWLAIYHQETEVPKTPPPPPPAAKPEKAAPSPTAAATPGTTSSDVTANEKLVWEALKTKNYDAFASYLAPEAIEVEPTGVTDKAGSVKGVQGFDLSKAALSEFKTVKFDDDAALVTYVARFPGATPEEERHTTIWANRNGKWLAILHQGTPVTPAPSPSPSK